MLILGLATTVLAHEYVLIARDFIVSQGDEIELHLFVADGFNVEQERPLQKSRTLSFELLSENGTTDLLPTSADEALPVLRVEADFKGLGLIHMERNYARVTLPNDRFVSYLEEDNIEGITIDNSTKTEQSEKYTRYIKTLIQSDPQPGDALYRHVVGHAFEIVLMDNPYESKENDWIRARVLFRGSPLADKVITARNRSGNAPAASQFSRTDQNGICTFKLDRRGDWFLHATHMIASPDAADADWESFWTAFSFGF